MRRIAIVGGIVVVVFAVLALVSPSSDRQPPQQLETRRPVSGQAKVVVHRPPRESRPINVSIGSEAIELSGVIARTHDAFHEHPTSPGIFVGGDITYGIKVERDTISIHPESWTRWSDKGPTRTGAALSLRTVAVSRHGTETRAAQPYELDPDTGTLTATLADGITEHLANTQSGLEQSWSFENAPSGSGDLDVRIAATGALVVANTGSGAHFRDLVGGIGLAYSQAKWIDASGAETVIPVRYEDGAIRLSVPAALLDSSSYPAVLDLTCLPKTGPRLRRKLTLSTSSGETDEEEQVHRRADGSDPARGRSHGRRRGHGQEARHQRPDGLHLA